MADSAPELDLRRYFDVLKRRKREIIGSILALVLATVGISLLRTPVFQGEALVLLRGSGSGLPFGTGQEDLDPELVVATEIQVLKSAPVRAAVSEQLGPVPEVSVRRVDTSLMIEVQARSTDRARAAELATAYARAYIDYRREQATQDLLAVASEVERTLANLEQELNELEVEMASAPASEAETLADRRDGLVSQRAVFRQRLDELQFQAAASTGQARLVSAAPLPESPVTPKPLRSGVLAAVGGLLLGVMLAGVREHLDDSIKTRADVGEAVAGVPVLGAIPAVPVPTSAGEPALIAMSPPATPASESFRTLRTSVQLLGVEHRLRTIQVTSPNEGEGKTTVVANLAAVMAQAGERVVVVDCDLRKPRAHLALGAVRSPGITSILSGDANLHEALQRVRIGDEEVTVLGAGPIPPNPSELLSSKRTSQLLFELQNAFDILLVDSPPVLLATDATILSTWVDATVLVANAGSTRARELQLTVEMLKQVEASVVGVVLNRVEERTHGYGYRYGDDLHARPRRVRSMSAARRARREVDPELAELEAEAAKGVEQARQ